MTNDEIIERCRQAAMWAVYNAELHFERREHIASAVSAALYNLKSKPDEASDLRERAWRVIERLKPRNFDEVFLNTLAEYIMDEFAK